MYELSLFGQVPASRHDQVLKVLTGVAAMAPCPLSERHLVYRPSKMPARKPAQVGGSQGIQDAQKAARQVQNSADMYYLQLVENLNEEFVASKVPEELASKEKSEILGSPRWSIRFYDIPEAGKRPVTARMMSITSVADGNPIGFMEGMGYQCVHQYATQGHQLVRHNTVIFLHRIFRYPQASSLQPTDTLKNPPPLQSLDLLDASGGYILHAYVRVLDGSKPESMNRGAAELATLKDMMKGCVDLRPVDRLALDTRVK